MSAATANELTTMNDNIWDSDSVSSETENSTSKCDTFPNGCVMLGKNVPLIKDDEQGVLRTDSFREYLERVEDFEDLRSMFISMLLDLKERVKGCEHCETCSQVIELVELNIRMCKKVSKLAHGFANVFMHIVNRSVPDKLNENAKHQLNVAFILLVKNSKFPDVQYIYDNFKAFINVDAFEGLALRLAIQKYKPADIRVMLNEWRCDPTVRKHRPIIRAFYYEKFGIVRNLIELGSSYKYYLQEDLSATEYQTFQNAIDKYLATQFPNSTAIEKEFHIVKMINDFRHILIEDDAKQAAECNEEPDSEYNPIATEYFLEDFMQYFYNTTGSKPIKTSQSNNTTSQDENENKKKKKKNKKKKKSKPKTNAAEPNAVETNATEPNAAETNAAEQNADIKQKPMELSAFITPEEKPLCEDETILDTNEYDIMNNETFNDDKDNDAGEDNDEDHDAGEDNDEDTNETILLDTYYSDMITTTLPSNQIYLGNWKSTCAIEYSTEASSYSYWDNHFQNVFLQYSHNIHIN